MNVRVTVAVGSRVGFRFGFVVSGVRAELGVSVDVGPRGVLPVKAVLGVGGVGPEITLVLRVRIVFRLGLNVDFGV